MTSTETDLKAMYTELASNTPSPHRVMANVLEASEAHRTPHRSRRTIARRIALGGVAAATIAAAGFVGVLITPAGHGPARIGAASADAQEVLRDASGAAAAEPNAVPRADQFVYVSKPGYEAWLSVDGAHDGEIRSGGDVTAVPGCVNGVAQEHGNYAGTRPQPCHADPAYIADAPTTAAAMTAYLTEQFGSAGANGIGKGIDFLLEFHLISPAARSALFDAGTSLPGLRVTKVSTSVVGVTWNLDGADGQALSSGTTLLFDATSHAFLGIQTNDATGSVSMSNVAKMVVVDKVGAQR